MCASRNDGDIIAQWDVTAHRWVLTQNVFASPYAVCVAISTTNDANGTYYLYQFSIPGNGFPDYPKWGIWPTNYGQSQNNFGPSGSSFEGPLACIYNRTKLLAGDPTAEQICHQYTSSEDSLLPADQDSATNPPTGQDQFFIGSVGDVDNSHLSLYSAHINNPADWSQGATFTGDGNSQLIPIASFTPACNGGYGGDCVPQKGITDKVDSLGDRLMYRFAYWNDGSAGVAALVGEFRRDRVVQPGWRALDGDHRCLIGGRPQRPQRFSARHMGSRRKLALDGFAHPRQGGRHPPRLQRVLRQHLPGWNPDLSVGLRCWPRAKRHPGNPRPEVELVAGAGSQPDTSNRWGDYSSMRIDQDGCTFWYTTEYYKVTRRNSTGARRSDRSPSLVAMAVVARRSRSHLLRSSGARLRWAQRRPVRRK